MDAESILCLSIMDLNISWVYYPRDELCCLEVAMSTKQPEMENLIRSFRIRTQCVSVSVQVPGLLYYKARVGEFATPFRVRQFFLPELPGGLANIIERYTDTWTIQSSQFFALMNTAFHVRNVIGAQATVRFLGYLKMQEVGECLCFRFSHFFGPEDELIS